MSKSLPLLLTVFLGFHQPQPASAEILNPTLPVVVAIIDTGVDSSHPLLQEHLWSNPGETGLDAQHLDKASNQLDDDHNGYIDDVHGWNFIDNSPRLTDLNGHGTHIAGIVAKESPKTKLMILKYFDDKKSGLENLQATIKAIRYALQMRVDLINFSGGGPGSNGEELKAIKAADEKNILFVAAAGNFSQDSDRFGFYPADYELENIISVASLDQEQNLLPSSNFGSRTVQTASWGQNILSTLPGHQQGVMTGTSQATAMASAAVANILLANPALRGHPAALKEQALFSGEFLPQLRWKTVTSRRLDAGRAAHLRNRQLAAAGEPISFSEDELTAVESLDLDQLFAGNVLP